jgi:hypothetical protein
MLELICDQSYTWNGVPADKTPYHNDGTGINTGGSYDGIAPGSGVITFPQPTAGSGSTEAGPGTHWWF